MTNTYDALEILAAQQGGYIVFPSWIGQGYEKTALYAGDLSACLDFIRANIVGPGGAEDDVAKAA